MTVIYCVICFLLGAGLLYLGLRNKLKATIKLDTQTREENAKIIEESQRLLQAQNQLNEKISNLNNDYNSLIKEIDFLKDKKKILDDNYQQASLNAEMYCQKANELASEKFAQSAEQMAQKYQQAENNYQQEYLKAIEESTKEYTNLIIQKQEELNKISKELVEAKAKQNAIVEANKRAEEVKQKEQFYKLNLSEIDIEEIKKLRSIIPYLRSAEPINKVIWKVYYEKSYTDLIGRVIGQGIHTGIYKITNIENQKCYIGQAVNIADRWKQHIKRGVGAEAPTRNKLYPAMYELGPEQFTFEILEECDKSLLDSREDYWQEFYQAKEFGYSIK